MRVLFSSDCSTHDSSPSGGHRPRANAGASLTNTDLVSPLAHRAGAETIAHAPPAGPADHSRERAEHPHQARNDAGCRRGQAGRCAVQRPGAAAGGFGAVGPPRCRPPRRCPTRRPDAAQPVDLTLPGTHQTADALHYRQGSLWIFATTLHDGWGDHLYFIYNPQTQALLKFRPESTLADHRGVSHKAQVQAIAAYTDRVGGCLEKTYLAAASGGFSAAVALKMGGYYVLTEQVAPFVSRTAVSAYRIGGPLAEARGKQVAEGFWMRVATAFGIQFMAGFTAGNGSVTQRGQEAFRGINGTSLLVSGGVNIGGLNLITLGKWLVPVQLRVNR